jgi:hypothetical protein
MCDIVCVQIFHALGNLSTPVDQIVARNQHLRFDDLMQAVVANFHHHAERLDAHTAERKCLSICF